jgi:hypothetical protein
VNKAPRPRRHVDRMATALEMASQGKTHAQIGEHLGITTKSATDLLGRARAWAGKPDDMMKARIEGESLAKASALLTMLERMDPARIDRALRSLDRRLDEMEVKFDTLSGPHNRDVPMSLWSWMTEKCVVAVGLYPLLDLLPGADVRGWLAGTKIPDKEKQEALIEIFSTLHCTQNAKLFEDIQKRQKRLKL